MRVGLWRKLSTENWCFWTMVLEKTLESPLDSKEIQPVHPKGDKSWVFIGRTCWSWNSNTLASSCKELTLWKIPWCWEGLGAGGEGDDRGWDSWMASPTRWTWVWVNSGSWWWTGRPGMLRFKESDTIEWLNWTELIHLIIHSQCDLNTKDYKRRNELKRLLEQLREQMSGKLISKTSV